METKIDDGGPAFPVPSYVNDSGETHESKPQGMTLRDWFAGQAMAALIAHTELVNRKTGTFAYGPGKGGDCATNWAIMAYIAADRMIESRKYRITEDAK